MLTVLVTIIAAAAGAYYYFIGRWKDAQGNRWSMVPGAPDGRYFVYKNGANTGGVGKTFRIINGVASVYGDDGALWQWINNQWVKKG